MNTKIFYFFVLISLSVNIFAQVGINTPKPNSKAGLHVSERIDPTSTNPDKYNGTILQRYTTAERDANFTGLTASENGLTIFNKTTGCYNYWDGVNLKWLNICGEPDPAAFTVNGCTAPTKVSGSYRAQTALTTTNTYALSLNVTATGTYTIRVNTTNGYYFTKSGIFANTGVQTVILDGVGTPSAAQTDAVTLNVNGANITPSCTLPSITVSAAVTSFLMDCSSATVTGVYMTKIPLDGAGGSQYIDVPITTVYTPGTVNVTSTSANGFYFSSGNVTISASTTSIRLYAIGTPSAIGTNIYQFKDPASNNTCNVLVTATSSNGTFANPVNRCTDILNENGSAPDGYYWLKGASNKFLTYCDMSNGGWTLVKSLSERQILVVEQTQAESLASQGSRNIVSTQTGVFNEYAFSLPAYVVNNIGSGSGFKEYRFTIKQAGHTTTTGATQAQVVSTTTAPVADVWTPNNYWNVLITDGNPSTGNYTSNGYTSEGKIFSYTLTKPQLGSNGTDFFFNGVAFAFTPPGMYSQAGFFTGFYGALTYAGNLNMTYTSSNGSSVTFNKTSINDLFGLYMNTEAQLNHHIGTCSNSTDDYGGVSQCAAGWANWRAHKFNQRPDLSYEGRIVQYWVK